MAQKEGFSGKKTHLSQKIHFDAPNDFFIPPQAPSRNMCYHVRYATVPDITIAPIWLLLVFSYDSVAADNMTPALPLSLPDDLQLARNGSWEKSSTRNGNHSGTSGKSSCLWLLDLSLIRRVCELGIPIFLLPTLIKSNRSKSLANNFNLKFPNCIMTQQ